ncbi:type VII secretion integral membrane protein EccD [Micromonospora craniellae]|uniref:Type VII secretion integral membrane protein EccD n=1 Tax=Micromonospora craniellae TaxID=2294034 RepID=A0A372FV17_9ACTN|nr:type VII secretion integral membrane protein EccD [Micromonospora craniellae]QOC89817.1 type VII secretion integral membrane protein EccD [Micromonospora craniellae]RFS44464.1 type VII secretion integral membrane protein EccD [Micromonospora craniellae]
MVTQAGTGLARIAVVAPHRRLDLALPEHLPLVGLLPAVLRQADEEPSDGTSHGGWTLRRSDGNAIDLTRTLAAQSIRDGETLHLVPRRTEWPELAYDDLMEAVADGARRRGVVWTPFATRLTGLIVAGVLLLLGLVVIVTSTEPGWIGGAVALGTAAVLLAGGIVLSRAMADSLAGAVVAAAGLPYAFVGGVLVIGSGESVWALGAPHVLLGSAVLLLSGLLGLLGVGDATRVFVAAVFVGFWGMVGGLLAFGSMDAAQGTAVVVSAVALLLPAMPLLSVRLGKMPMPALPRTAEDLLRDEPQPRREIVYQATARADEVLTGMIFGAFVITVSCLVVLTATGAVSALLLAGVISLGYLLRARLVSTVRHRVPMLAVGLAGLGLLPLVGAADASTAARVLAVLPVALVAAGLAAAAGLAYSRRPPSPRLARLGDVLDILLQLAIVPVACSVLGLYAFMRAING